MRFFLLLCLSASAFGAEMIPMHKGNKLTHEENKLTREEKQAGWKLLFDGKTFHNWNDPGDSWAIEDGVITTRLHPKIEEDLVTRKSYADFELAFDWRVAEGANTGVKYRMQRAINLDPSEKGPFEKNVQRELDQPSVNLKTASQAQVYTVAFEMQLIDDARHPDAKKDANHVTGALYSMLPPAKHPAYAAGQWNHSRIVVKGERFEHWINGELVLSGSLDDPKGLDNLKQRWSEGPAVYEMLAHARQSGQITLQHHGDKAWFRNVKIREYKEGIWAF